MKLIEFAELVSGLNDNNESKAIVSLSDSIKSCENIRIRTTTIEADVKFWSFEEDKSKTIISLCFNSFEHQDFCALKLMINTYSENNFNGERQLKLYIFDKETSQHAIAIKIRNAMILQEAPMITFEVNTKEIKYKHMQ